jgi:tRNA threonylcarbamoyladenosine biosynthesis protein TsaE
MGLGIEEDILSPTYTLINEYEGRLDFHHMDAYRLGGEEEFLALGTEEIMSGGGVTVIEWSERVSGALPAGHSVVSMETVDGDRRLASIEGPLEAALS